MPGFHDPLRSSSGVDSFRYTDRRRVDFISRFEIVFVSVSISAALWIFPFIQKSLPGSVFVVVERIGRDVVLGQVGGGRETFKPSFTSIFFIFNLRMVCRFYSVWLVYVYRMGVLEA